MIFLGIDPGMSGGIGVMTMAGDAEKANVSSVIFNKMTEMDISIEFESLKAKSAYSGGILAFIENVHGFPGMSVVAVSSFMGNFGFLRGCLYSHNIPFDLVSPQRWQKELGCRTHGDKNISKAKAQQLFPELKITHANADAILLAEYCRRIWKQRYAVGITALSKAEEKG